MNRESAEVKARRLLVEGRVIVEMAGPGYFTATVRGSGDVHVVTYGPGGWSCTCPARSSCSHLCAAALVAAPNPPPRRTP